MIFLLLRNSRFDEKLGKPVSQTYLNWMLVWDSSTVLAECVMLKKIVRIDKMLHCDALVPEHHDRRVV
jgi:hypothetical protein